MGAGSANSAEKVAGYIEPTPVSGQAFVARAIAGEVCMLNLLCFREMADYSASPELAPPSPISGAEAYDLDVAHALPFLQASGGELLFVA